MPLKVLSVIFIIRTLFVIFDQYLLTVKKKTSVRLGIEKKTNNVEATAPSLGRTEALVGEYTLSYTVSKEISISLTSQTTRFTRTSVNNSYI